MIQGDATDSELWDRINHSSITAIFLTIPGSEDDQRHAIIRQLRDHGYQGRIIASTEHEDEVPHLLEIGANVAHAVATDAGLQLAALADQLADEEQSRQQNDEKHKAKRKHSRRKASPPRRMFDPSIKQLDALANMERFLGIASNRTHFGSQNDFQDYWNLLDTRCKKQRRQLQQGSKQPTCDAPAQTSGQTSSNKKQRALQKHYRQRSNLVAYARKYYQRYFPSQQRLLQQLSMKCDQPEVVAQAMQDLEELIDDQRVATLHMHRLRGQGKNQREMNQALRRKQFSDDIIENTAQDLLQPPYRGRGFSP